MARKLEINKGDKFGKLTIIVEAEKIIEPKTLVFRRVFTCQCECGKIKNVRLNDLKNGKVVSCGCKKKEVSVKVGDRYGNLVIEKFVDRNVPSLVRVGLVCDCGNRVEMNIPSLKIKKDKSCGCKKLYKIGRNEFTGLSFNIGHRRHMLTYVRDVEPRVKYFKKPNNDKSYKKTLKLIEVLCDCGKLTIKGYGNVKKGGIKSCGCLLEYVGEKMRGRPSSKKVHFTEEQVDRMVELFNQKINLRKIGKEFGVSDPLIKSQLISRGCTIKQRRHDITEDYFKIVDSEEKAYWLGFLAADGCIRRRVRDDNGKTRGDSIALKLSVLDEHHMIRFRDSICPSAKITYYTNKLITKKGTLSISHTCNLKINGNEIVKDIMNLGVGPRKTFTIQKPNINQKYYRDYIRGFFDGDGCCYIKKLKGKRDYNVMSIRYSLACASKDLRDFFSEELQKLEITTSCYDNLSLNITGGFLNSVKFFKYLYTDATIYLQRKYDKGMIFIEHFNKLPNDAFINEYVYNPYVKRPDTIWTEDELKILIETNNVIPYSYLAGTYLPNKSKQQIHRMRKKLGLKSRRKIPGYLKMKTEIKNQKRIGEDV